MASFDRADGAVGYLSYIISWINTLFMQLVSDLVDVNVVYPYEPIANHLGIQPVLLSVYLIY